MRTRAWTPWALLALAALPAQGALRVASGAGVRLAPAVGGLAPLAAPTIPEISAPDGLARVRASLQARDASPETMALAEQVYYTDPLTGLPNRAYFDERGAQALRAAQRPMVALLDMNNFGAINVGLAEFHGVVKGRARADAILAIAGSVLGELAKQKGVTVARLGGEEFAVIGGAQELRAFLDATRAAITQRKLLRAAEIAPDERRSIRRALQRAGRAGQPFGSFTAGAASAQQRALAQALEGADAALNSAKEKGRGSVRLVYDDGAVEDVPPPLHRTRWFQPRFPPTSTKVDDVLPHLNRREGAIFMRAVFRDPLTLTRRYQFLGHKIAAWDRRYADGGTAALVSARNLKQINDRLGHKAGDRYLRRLGVILRREVNRSRMEARANGKDFDVQEPIRAASKDFLLIGRDARAVADRVAAVVAEEFAAGKILTQAQVSQLRQDAADGLLSPDVPGDRVQFIGTLRVVDEPIDATREGVAGAVDRAYEQLERQKRSETSEKRPGLFK